MKKKERGKEEKKNRGKVEKRKIWIGEKWKRRNEDKWKGRKGEMKISGKVEKEKGGKEERKISGKVEKEKGRKEEIAWILRAISRRSSVLSSHLSFSNAADCKSTETSEVQTYLSTNVHKY